MKSPTKSFPFGWWTFKKDHYGLVDKHDWESLQQGAIDFIFDWCDWRIIRQGNMNWRLEHRCSACVEYFASRRQAEDAVQANYWQQQRKENK